MANNFKELQQVNNPFFKIRIGGPNPTKKKNTQTGEYEFDLIDLPDWVHELVSSIEISQLISQEKSEHKLTLSFVEGSREGVTERLKELASKGANDTGTVLDLQMKEGVVQLTTKDDRDESKKKTKTEEDIFDKKKTIDELKKKRGTKKETDEIEKLVAEMEKLQEDFRKLRYPKFVFRELNTIEITFGWLEPEVVLRKCVFTIQQISHSASAGSMPITTIIAIDPSAELAKSYPTKQIAFFEKSPNSENKLNYWSPTKIVFKVADILGYEPYISPVYYGMKADKKCRKIMSGQSVWGFLQQLAKEYQAHLFIDYNWKLGKYILGFLSTLDMEKYVYRNYTWKNGENNLLAYNIGHSIEIGKEQSNTASNKESKENKQTPVDRKLSVFLQSLENKNQNVKYKIKTTKLDENKTVGEGSLVSDPATGALITKAMGVSISGGDDTSPDEKVGIRRASSQTSTREKDNVRFDATFIGDPYLCPSVIKVEGIGLRYSGRYYVQQTIHKINASGYFTDIHAQTNAINKDGKLAPTGPPPPKQKKSNLKAKVHLMEDDQGQNVEFTLNMDEYSQTLRLSGTEIERMQKTGLQILNLHIQSGQDGHFATGNIGTNPEKRNK